MITFLKRPPYFSFRLSSAWANRLRTNHPVIILSLGLIIAQAIAALHVYLSNLGLFNTMTAVTSAGYLAVPGKHVMGSLLDFGPTFWGGFFLPFPLEQASRLAQWLPAGCGFDCFGIKKPGWFFGVLFGPHCCSW